MGPQLQFSIIAGGNSGYKNNFVANEFFIFSMNVEYICRVLRAVLGIARNRYAC
jgi:hypothetical protein